MDDVRNTITDEIRTALEAQSFDSMDEVQAFLDDFREQRNRRPMDDFHGLSPHDVHSLLHYPLEAPEVVQVATELDAEPGAPLARLFRLLAEAIGDKGLKPTVKGNLPRNTCREVTLGWLGDAGYEEYTRIGGINGEHDAPEVHTTRIVAELAGLIRKYRGRFILSRRARRLLSASGMRALYPALFRTYATAFNWAYRDGYDSAPFVQQAWLFTVYLLHLYGGEERPAEFYADAFLQAFPAVEAELTTRDWTTPEQYWRSLYTTRCLERFVGFTGLADIRYESGRKQPFEPCYLRATPLLDEMVLFSER